MAGFTLLDLLAALVFVVAWAAYAFHTEVGAGSTLNAAMDAQRAHWMRRMAERENRIVDTTIMASLQNGAAFFASASLLATGGTLSALGATDEALAVFENLPFAVETTRAAFEVKVLGLAAIFVYAFFKLAWSYRLFNYAAILIGTTPLVQAHDEAAVGVAVERATRMNVSAARHFNRGLRGFFFALAYLGWFAGPLFLIGTSLAVVFVLLRRQLASESLEAATWGGGS